jgi:hypothetical protein
MLKRALAQVLVVFTLSSATLCQQPASTNGDSAPGTQTQSTPPDFTSDIKLKKLPLNLMMDQKRIWTGPVHLKTEDLKWAIPLTFGTALAFGMDHAVVRNLPSASTVKNASTFSNAGAAAAVGIVGFQYLWGLHTHNEKLRETGYLSGEAAIDSLLLTTLTKSIARRERPQDNLGQGRFFESSSAINSSFASQHSSAAFSIATVIAHEYPGYMTKFLAYGGASAIGAARVIGNQHFTSDVLIGSALGYYIGRQVYGGHAAEAREDRWYGTFERRSEPKVRDASMMASPYVPLDSWIYPVLDRLEASAYLRSTIIGIRPWTRKQCAQMIDDIEVNEQDEASELTQTVEELRAEFAPELRLLEGHENLNAQIEDVYTRFTGIGGSPVNDAIHFGQTIIDDYGRPYQQGFNLVTGATAHAEAGPFGAYIRAEYQHSPSSDPFSLATRQAISAEELLPLMPGSTFPAINRPRVIEAYVALNVDDWQLSFGKQSMWLDPTVAGSLMISNNAEAMTMLKLSRVAPLKLPSIFRLFGPVSTSAFIGQAQGYHFLRLGPTFQLTGSWDTYVNPQPFVWGGAFSLKPTENLEIGVSLTTMFAGLGRPLTLGTFRHTLSSSGNVQAQEPGDRRSNFNFRYRVPGLRRWLTLYSGSMAEDEPNPIAYPRRSSMSPGIYLTHIPKFEKLDLRVESEYTDIPNLQLTPGVYTNTHYANGYTSNGNIIGSWIGPEARSVQVMSNYWFDTQRKLTFSFRSQRVNPDYLQGGNLKDFSAGYSFKVPNDIQVTTSLQYENWNFPLLASERKSNVVVAVEMKWRPKIRFTGRDK